MNAMLTPVPTEHSGALAPQRDMESVLAALKSSHYPGASDASIEMVLAYCRARNLDVMTKPVHIVPVWVPEKREGNRVVRAGGMRDVVMPGIATYRIDAHRTGEYAGQDEADYGPTLTRKFTDGDGAVTVEFPEWAKVTVYRMRHGVRIAYSAKVFWLEAYSTAGRNTQAPNAMWRKRPHGQLEKCAEALALRKGFPEAIGNEPTAEEMEGKAFIDADYSNVSDAPAASALPAMPKSRAAPAASVIDGAAERVEREPAQAREPARESSASREAEPQAGAGGASGIELADGAKRTLMLRAKQAGMAEDDLLAKWSRIDLSNLNTVLGELRKIQDAKAGAE